MRMCTPRALFLCGLLVVAPLLGSEADAARRRSSGRKSTKSAQKEADPGVLAIEKRNWKAGEEYYRQAIVEACSGKSLPPFKALEKLHFGYNVCRYFPAIGRNPWPQAEQRKFEKWLLANTGFTRTLLMAVRPRDDVPVVFSVVRALRKKSSSMVKRHKSLAVAFAIVWDDYRLPDQAVVEAFAYYTTNIKKMRFDPRKMPPAILKYVVDSRRPVGEREWALKRYGSISEMNRIYTMPKYDEEASRKGKSPEISRHKDTLQNLRKYRGYCVHRAVFASEVGKAQGTPCVYISGGTTSGLGHAWIGYLKRRGQGYAWNRDSGRIGDEDITYGRILEPQEGSKVSEYELELALRALKLSGLTRREAQVWLEVAQILAKADKPEEAAAAMKRSLQKGVFDKSQWIAYADLTRRGVFDEKDVQRAVGDFATRLRSYPNLAVDAFEVLVEPPAKENAEDNLKLFDLMLGRFPRKTVAEARIRLLKGRYLEMLGRTNEAQDVYAGAALKAMKVKALGLQLLDNAARLMIDRGRLKKAVELHKRAYYKTEEIKSDPWAIYATRFDVGVRYAKVSELAKDKKTHDRILRGIVSKFRKGSQARNALFNELSRRTYLEINRTRKPVAK